MPNNNPREMSVILEDPIPSFQGLAATLDAADGVRVGQRVSLRGTSVGAAPSLSRDTLVRAGQTLQGVSPTSDVEDQIRRYEEEAKRLRNSYRESLQDFQGMDKHRRRVQAELQSERNSNKELQKQCDALTKEINKLRDILFESGLLK